MARLVRYPIRVGIIGIFLMCGYVLSVFAGEVTLLTPGEYKVVVQLDLPHLRNQGARSSENICCLL